MNQAALRTLQQAGYKVPEVPQYLGEGCYAQTYALDDTRVFKITSDPTDAQTAAWVNRAQRSGMCRNLVRIDKVWKISGTGGYDGKQPLHLIVAERLVPVPRELFDRWKLPRFMQALGDTPYDTRDLVKIAEAWANGTATMPSHYNYETGKYERRPVNYWGCISLNLKGIADDLRDLGVEKYADFHLDNVMYRPGDRVVLSDFGSARTPPLDIEEGC